MHASDTHPARKNPATSTDAQHTPAEVEFMLAVEAHKRENRRPLPTWSEALGVLHALGYRKGGGAARGGKQK